MFGRKKKKSQSPVAKSGAADTLISKEANISGDIHFSGVLHVDGNVKGDIVAEEDSESLLTVGQNGFVEGEIKAPHVVVFGGVKGDVYGLEYVELMPEARIEGNVHYKLIEMAMGAEVNGQMHHKEDDPKLLSHRTSESSKSADSE